MFTPPTQTPSQQSNGQLNLACDGTIPGNAGCGITEWSQASYGPTFDAQGGGVFAMKWDEDGISVCKLSMTLESPVSSSPETFLGNFYRAAVPKDIQSGQPSPSTWGQPVAMLLPTTCDPIANFINHSIIFGEVICRSFRTPFTDKYLCRHHFLWRLGWKFLCNFRVPWNMSRQVERALKF